MNNINYITIKNYLEGRLDEKEMYELEKQALEDPFLADAIEGYSHARLSSDSQLSILQKQLEDRIAQQQENKNVFNYTWQRLSVAAVAAVMFISAGILFWMKASIPAQNNSSIKQVQVLPFVPNSGAENTADYLTSQAQPSTGWPAYNEYVKKNNRFPATEKTTGEVIVAFTVDKETGVPGNYKILRGLNRAYNEEAIRLIKEGPVWIPDSSEKNPEVRVTVKFQP
ncbi:energy transducer TonB [Rubrolithibacter danxiaensis]|uniref:energy transducer TonB n=1 Tax=Rubrolithibacter danxiaensis TaxID=3390805 RepID=UPI003BF78EA3